MSDNDLKIYTALSSFTEKGMSLAHDYSFPGISDSELKVIANYYSIIFDKTRGSEGLFGPLPVAYHTEYLMYVYSFTIKDSTVEDSRIINNDNLVQASLLILFPTLAETQVNLSRDKLSQGIKAWKANFNEVKEISLKNINKLNSTLSYSINKDFNGSKFSESKKITTVLSRSIELLYNVSNYLDDPLKIVIAGTDDLLFQLSRVAFLGQNPNIIDSFTIDKNIMKINLGKVIMKIILLPDDKPNIQKYLSNDLTGVMYFGNFSNPKLSDIHAQQLEEIIKNTSQNCLISFAVSQTIQEVSIEETKLPLYLAKGKGRTISLFDLANKNMSLGRAIIESLDKLVEVTARIKE